MPPRTAPLPRSTPKPMRWTPSLLALLIVALAVGAGRAEAQYASSSSDTLRVATATPVGVTGAQRLAVVLPGSGRGVITLDGIKAFVMADVDLSAYFTTAALTDSLDARLVDYASAADLEGRQPLDPDLTTYASITPSANVQSLLGAASYSAMRTQLGLVVGADVQAWDNDLAALADDGVLEEQHIDPLIARDEEVTDAISPKADRSLPVKSVTAATYTLAPNDDLSQLWLDTNGAQVIGIDAPDDVDLTGKGVLVVSNSTGNKTFAPDGGTILRGADCVLSAPGHYAVVNNFSTTSVEVRCYNGLQGADEQTIDVFAFDAGTSILSLSIEGDAEATKQVDLSPLNPVFGGPLDTSDNAALGAAVAGVLYFASADTVLVHRLGNDFYSAAGAVVASYVPPVVEAWYDDQSGSGYDITVVGDAASATATIGGATRDIATLDGTGDGLYVLDVPGVQSIHAWAENTAVSTYLYDLRARTGSTISAASFLIYGNSNTGTVDDTFYINDGAATTNPSVAVVPDGLWKSVLATFDAGPVGITLTLGMKNDNSGGFLNGSFGPIALFGTALTPTQRTLLHNSGVPLTRAEFEALVTATDLPAPVAYYFFTD